MIKLLTKIPFALLPILIVVGINFYVDPGNLFNNNYEKTIAAIQSSGRNACVDANYNDRLAKIEYVQLIEESPEIVAIGSSRVMGITSEMVGSESFYNFGVAGAGMMDLVGILGLLKEKEFMPKTVIIGLDPWMFNDNNGDTRHLVLERAINIFHENNDFTQKWGPSISIKKYTELISPSYFQTSLHSLLENGISTKTEVRATKETADEGMIVRFDGAVSYGAAIRYCTVDEVRVQAKAYISGGVYQLNEFNKLSEMYKGEFKALIQYLRDHQVKVVLYLPPYHPLVYAYLREIPEYRSVLEVEKYVRDFAQEYQLDLIGSYDPSIAGNAEEDFFDGMHLQAGGYRAIKKIYR